MFEDEDKGGFYEEDFSEDLKRFQDMLNSDENYFFDVDAFEYISDYFIDNGELKTALKALELGISQHPFSSTLLLIKAQIHANSGRLQAGQELIAKAAQLDPNNGDIWITKANLCSQEHKHLEAIECIKKAITLVEDEIIDDLYLDLAFEYGNIEDYNAAIKTLKKALQINPDNESALYEICYCFDQANKLAACESYCNEFIDENPYSFTAWYILGNTLVKLDKVEDAIAAYDFCITIEPKFSSAYYNIASCNFQIENYQAAIENYELVLHHETGQATTFNNLAECYEKLEKFDKAEEYYKKAIADNDKYPEAYLGLAIVKDRIGKTKESISLLKTAIELDNKNAEYWHVLGEAYEKIEQIELSISCFLKVTILQPDNIEAWLDYSNLIAQSESEFRAIEIIEEALSINENQELLLYRLVAYLLKTGKSATAKTFLEKALSVNFDAHTALHQYYPTSKEMSEIIEIIDSFRE